MDAIHCIALACWLIAALGFGRLEKVKNENPEHEEYTDEDYKTVPGWDISKQRTHSTIPTMHY